MNSPFSGFCIPSLFSGFCIPSLFSGFRIYVERNLNYKGSAGVQKATRSMKGMSWRREPSDFKPSLFASQALGVSEAFNLNVTENYVAGDYLYYFGGIDGVWLGLWGTFRVVRQSFGHRYMGIYRKIWECLR